jgi:multidrug efflux pump subunit AcrB
VGQGFNNSSGERLPLFRVKMNGYNYEELERQANLLAAKLLKHERIQKVNINDRFDWGDRILLQPSFALEPATLALQGLVTNDVVNQLRYEATQEDVSLYLPVNGKWTPVVAKEKDAKGVNLYRIVSQPYYYKDRYFDLSNAKHLMNRTTAPPIRREDRQFVRIVGFEYYGSNHFGQQFLDNVLKEMKSEMPVGYSAEHLTDRWNWDKSKRQYSLLLLLFIGIYITCLIHFENLKQPLVVISVIPISFIGLFLTFGWFGFFFDQGGFAAFILLGGLSVNASIFILMEFNSRREKGIVKAAYKKSTAVLLTILSTCIGLVPFLIGGEDEVFWFALAAGTIGGLLFSLIGTFVIVPMLFFNKKTCISIQPSALSH